MTIGAGKKDNYLTTAYFLILMLLFALIYYRPLRDSGILDRWITPEAYEYSSKKEKYNDLTSESVLAGVNAELDRNISAVPPKDDVSATLAALDRYPSIVRQSLLLQRIIRSFKVGGLKQFFETTDADFAPEIAEAMNIPKFASYRAVMLEAMSAFGEIYPRDFGRRRELLRHSEDVLNIRDSLDVVPLGNRLRSLSQRFGSIENYVQAVDALIKDKSAADFLSEAQKRSNDSYNLAAFRWEIDRRLRMRPRNDDTKERRLASLSSSELTVYYALDSKSLLGSNDFVYFTPHLSDAEKLVQALEKLELPRHAFALQQSFAAVPQEADGEVWSEAELNVLNTAFEETLSKIWAGIDTSLVETNTIAFAKREGVIPN